MQYRVSHGVFYERSKYWYIISFTLLLLLSRSMLVMHNSIGIVLLLLFVASYCFYAFILVPKETFLSLTSTSFEWNTMIYERELFSSFFVDYKNPDSIYCYFQKKDGTLLSMNLYCSQEELKEFLDEVSQYLPFEEPRKNLIDRILEIIKL